MIERQTPPDPGVEPAGPTGHGEIEGFRLSPQQRRLFEIGGWAGASSARIDVRLEGAPDRAALERALDSLVRRHEILRTRFPVAEPGSPPLQVIDEDAGVGWAERTVNGGAGLEEGAPVLRASLDRRAEGLWRLRCELPIACADPRTLRNLFLDLVEAYAAARRGETSGEDGLPYVVFSEWQNDLAEEEARSEHPHWARFAGTEATSLPLGRIGAGRPPESETGVATVDVELDDRTLAGLHAPPGSLEPGPFVCACWHALASRLCGRSEVMVGHLVDGRSFPDLEPGYGLFAKVVPVVTREREGTGLLGLATRIAEAMRLAHRWQDRYVPRVETPGRPAFPLQIEIQAWPSARRAEGVGFSAEFLRARFEPFEVKLVVVQQDGRLRLAIEYDRSLFRAEDVRSVADSFATLLAAGLAGGPVAVAELPLLSPVQRRVLNLEPDEGPGPEPARMLLDELDEGFRTHSHRIAVVHEGTYLTYGELDARAGKLARRLRASGAPPGAPVAVLLHRGVDLVVAVLGAWRAGSPYLPLDPGQPDERLLSMIADAGAAFLVTETAQSGRLADADLRSVRIDEPATEEACDLPAPVGSPPPEAAAYIVFTSGSTGRPKGVVVEHRHLSRYVRSVCEALELPGDASYASVSTFAADLGNTAIFPALAGGCLHIVSEDTSTDPEAFDRYLEGRRVDCLKIVPGHLAALAWRDRPRTVFPRLRLILGGEAVATGWVETLRSPAGDCRIFNHYGPTEATVGALTFAVPAEGPLPDTATLPIGRPLPAVDARLVDARLRPVPPGIPGELCLGGDQVARGYAGRPGATAERFVPDPFSGRPGGRLYRSGDLCRRLSGGEVEILGRIDRQVKIRGFRIEPGEIEAALRDRFDEALVVPLDDPAGGRRLVAFVAPAGGPGTASEAKVWLAGRLPAPMVPSSIVALEALPRTANGKIDRAALETMGERGDLTPAGWTAPRTAAEEAVAGIWREVLGRDRVGAQDDFFDLGGHSLLTPRVLFRIRSVFGVDLPLSLLFEVPTVAGLAAAVEGAAPGVRIDELLVPLQEGRGERPLFLVHPVFGDVSLYRHLARGLGPERPVYGVQPVGLTSNEAPLATVEAMAERYLGAVRSVQPRGPYLLAGSSMGGTVAYEMAARLTAGGEEVAFLGLLDTWAGDDPALRELPDPGIETVLMTYLTAQGARGDGAGRLERLDPTDRLDFLLDLARSAGALPTTFERDDLERLITVTETGRRAARAYRPRPYPGALDFFRASESGVEARPERRWAELAGGGVTVHPVAGSHVSMLIPPHVAGLAELLRHHLERVGEPA